MHTFHNDEVYSPEKTAVYNERQIAEVHKTE